MVLTLHFELISEGDCIHFMGASVSWSHSFMVRVLAHNSVDGIVIDAGCSSLQFDTPPREALLSARKGLWICEWTATGNDFPPPIH